MTMTPEELKERFYSAMGPNIALEWLDYMGFTAEVRDKYNLSRSWSVINTLIAYYPDDFLAWWTMRRLLGKYIP